MILNYISNYNKEGWWWSIKYTAYLPCISSNLVIPLSLCLSLPLCAAFMGKNHDRNKHSSPKPMWADLPFSLYFSFSIISTLQTKFAFFFPVEEEEEEEKV